MDPISLERSYLGRAQDCFDIMREKGLGITNADLEQVERAEDTVVPDYTQAKQTIGQATDGLGLAEIRHADHGFYYRFVFDISTQDGEVVNDIIPYTEVTYSDSYDNSIGSSNVIKIVINGIRKDLTGNEILVPIVLDDARVWSYMRNVIHDDSAISYTIALNESSEYYLHSLTDPARIILDIKK